MFEYSIAALVAAHTSFRDLIDIGAGAASIKIKSSTGTLLAEVLLDDPSGTVDEETGQLTLDILGPDLDADASGTAVIAEICDGDGEAHLSMPCKTGVQAEAGFCVLNTVSIVAGGTVEVVSAVIG